MKTIAGTVLAVALACGSASAINITIFDGQAGNGAAGPWKNTPGSNAGNEDNETEPRTATGDLWDLEAFLLNGSRLSIVATFDLKNGAPAYHVTAGDIFFDTDGLLSSDGLSGWDYVLHLNWRAQSYQLFSAPAASRLIGPTDIAASAPVAYQPQPHETPLLSGQFDYGVDNTLGFLSENPSAPHYVATFDIEFLRGQDFLAHFTLSCGNDLLRGRGSLPHQPGPRVPDSGSSAALLGLACLGLLGLERRLRRTPALAATLARPDPARRS